MNKFGFRLRLYLNVNNLTNSNRSLQNNLTNREIKLQNNAIESVSKGRELEKDKAVDIQIQSTEENGSFETVNFVPNEIAIDIYRVCRRMDQ